MSKLDPSELLHLQSAEPGGKSSFCPDDQEIADYFHDGLDEIRRTRLDRHFIKCRHCRARIGMIERLRRLRANVRVPEELLATAKQLKSPTRRHKAGVGPAWAVAAVLVISMYLFTVDWPPSAKSPGESTGRDQVSEDSGRQLRSIDFDSKRLSVLTPQPATAIRPGTLIEWNAVPERLFYDLSIITFDGNVLTTQRTKETHWSLDGSLPLEVGPKYYVRIVAHLPDGRKVNSRHVDFQIAPEIQ